MLSVRIQKHLSVAELRRVITLREERVQCREAGPDCGTWPERSACPSVNPFPQVDSKEIGYDFAAPCLLSH